MGHDSPREMEDGWVMRVTSNGERLGHESTCVMGGGWVGGFPGPQGGASVSFFS